MWLHGTRGNAALELAQSLGLVDASRAGGRPSRKTTPLAGRPRTNPSPRAGCARTASRRTLRRCAPCGRRSATRSRLSNHPRTARTMRQTPTSARSSARARARLVGDETPPDAALVDAVWRWSTDLQCAIDGCGDLDEQGLHAYRNYEELGGSHLPGSRLVGGFSGPRRRARRRGQPAAPRVDTARHARRRRRVEQRRRGARVRRRRAAARTGVRPRRAAAEALSNDALRAAAPARNAEGLSKLELGAVEKIFVPFSAADDGTPPPTLNFLWAGGAGGAGAQWPRALHSLSARQRGHAPHRVADRRRGARRQRPSVVGAAARAPRGPRTISASVAATRRPRDQLDHLAAFQRRVELPRVGAPKDVAQALAAPLGRLSIAGEATSPQFFGTLHGAVESGQRRPPKFWVLVST